ncbi:putative outer membrane protein PmpB [Streptomyces sp. MBT84]|uniref:hypothetical protein n=1 Tax=unclassified Streptomyces TaxID=2593676 RepID=UPI001C6F175B|nr:hypothetical protein [Streptomyces sp. MBT84]MBW8706503.1 putative outer membrane protein PmpB [Streptomyces sp. MBT84]
MSLVARTGGAVAALSLGLAVLPAIPAYAAVVHVGCSVQALRGAIDTANGAGGGIIDLASECRYTLTDAVNPGSSDGFSPIAGDVTLRGGRHTVIERSTAPGTPQFRLFQVSEPNGKLTLNRLTLRNGGSDFGGVALVFGSLAVFDSELTDNHVAIQGGAINGQPGSTVSVTSSRVERNTASSAGGGISSFGTVTLTRTAVNMNTAGLGGGVASVGTVTFNRSWVTGNAATSGRGGGVAMLGGTSTFESTHVTRNTAADVGGGISSSGELIVRRTTVLGNSAGSQGGGIWSGGTTRIDGSELIGNRTTAVGSQGGGLYTASGTATVNRSRVVRNRDGASGNGGGIYEQSGSTVTLGGTLVADNLPNNCAPPAAVPGCGN